MGKVDFARAQKPQSNTRTALAAFKGWNMICAILKFRIQFCRNWPRRRSTNGHSYRYVSRTRIFSFFSTPFFYFQLIVTRQRSRASLFRGGSGNQLELRCSPEAIRALVFRWLWEAVKWGGYVHRGTGENSLYRQCYQFDNVND